MSSRQLRLVSGLVLATYLVTHLSNHALGLISVSAAEAGRWWFLALWRKHRVCNPSMETIAGRTGVVFRRNGQVSGTTTFNIQRERIVEVWTTLNPDKLVSWAEP